MSKSRHPPRVVVVTRPTPYEQLLARHGTHGQAAFFLEGRQLDIEPIHAAHELQQTALQRVTSAVPTSWRRATVSRAELDRFLFEGDDIVVAVGQDGLVANAAKYLADLLVVGVNPDPSRHDGILVRHPAAAVGDLLGEIERGRHRCERRTMVEVTVDGGASLDALNEVFVGHRTHQSSRYRLRVGRREERQSSSGLIVSTGTGATGWARSIARQRHTSVDLPAPCDPGLALFVREAFPSVATGTSLDCDFIGPDESVEICSEMEEGGVIFGDGIEEDRIRFDWGRRAVIRRSAKTLRLVV